MFQIIYLKHPVTEEQKQKCLMKGYKILDIKFAPKDYVNPMEEELGANGEPVKKRGRPKKIIDVEV